METHYIEEFVYNVEPTCHPDTPLTFYLPVKVNLATGGTEYPDSELIAVCPTCGEEYAGANKGASLHVRKLDLADPRATFDLLHATFAP
jgi:hypothetical protein